MLDPHLREKLTALEPETPSLKEKYQKEIDKMIEKELTPNQRIYKMFEIGVGLIIFFAGLFAFALLGRRFSLFLNFIFLFTALFGLSGSIFSAYILWRGKVHVRQFRIIEMSLIWGFGSITLIGYMLHAAFNQDRAEGALKLLFAYPLLFILIMATLHRYIEKTGIELKEHILRLELKIAEMNERMTAKPDDEKKE